MKYYVERVIKETGYGYKTEWYVMQAGEGAKCRTKDAGFAYEMVDLLNGRMQAPTGLPGPEPSES